MTTLSFYREQAAREQSRADEATLVNARERSQRAADAWSALAERVARAQAARDERTPPPASEINENPDRGRAAPKELWSDVGVKGWPA